MLPVIILSGGLATVPWPEVLPEYPAAWGVKGSLSTPIRGRGGFSDTPEDQADRHELMEERRAQMKASYSREIANIEQLKKHVEAELEKARKDGQPESEITKIQQRIDFCQEAIKRVKESLQKFEEEK